MGSAQRREGWRPARIIQPPDAQPAVTAPIDALGYAAATLTTVSFLPQATKTLRTGDTKAISLRMYLLFTSGVALWGIYGVLRGDGPLIVANAITLVSAGLILERKLRAVLSGRR
jgi:MtN3 and saliva related transmembrane protein